jgi:cyclophilin family peptidyl-prolyl cis-trans isomerase
MLLQLFLEKVLLGIPEHPSNRGHPRVGPRDAVKECEDPHGDAARAEEDADARIQQEAAADLEPEGRRPPSEYEPPEECDASIHPPRPLDVGRVGSRAYWDSVGLKGDGPTRERGAFPRLRLPQPMSNPVVKLETNLGAIRAEIFEDKSPTTARNFLGLVRKGFYNGLTFHRVIPGFMIQGGDPSGDGTGGPGYEIPDEFHSSLHHVGAGILSMANAGPNTGGSQFFITLAATPWLDGKHAIFGRVVSGMEVLEQIGKVSRDRNDRPKSAVTIARASVE